MKNISTLIADIENLLDKGTEEVPEEIISKYEGLFGNLLRERLKPPETRRTLRMSNIGKPERQLWYEINEPEKGERLRPETRMKFLYGDVTELLLLFLAEASGHSVEGTQDEQSINGIKGHRDAVIDGVITDAKSASPYSFKKFKDHTLKIEGNDPFGYLAQLGSYQFAGRDDPLVIDKEQAAFFVLDKVGGNLCLDLWPRTDTDYSALYDQRIQMVAGPKPMRCFEDEPEGKSGNRKLGTQCSYCAFKRDCWPGLRVFKYYKGPVFLTYVKLEPKVPELSWDYEDVLEETSET